MNFGITRRALLAGLSAQAAELQKFRDPATEFDVVRLTGPEYASWIPPAHLRVISQRSGFLLFVSDRLGARQPFRLDLRTGQIAPAGGNGESPDPDALALLPGDRHFCYAHARGVNQAGLSRGGRRTLYEVESGWERAPGFGVADDGRHLALVERREARHRLRLVPLSRSEGTTIAEYDGEIADPQLRPRRAGLLYRRGASLWLVNYDGQQNRPLRLAQDGVTGSAQWSADGKTILYLHFPSDKKRLYELREATPDTNEDKLVARTSQFVAFAVNSDGSVFAGASANKASAHVLLLLRTTRRELTICEHRASNPRQVNVRFSPSSQRLFFQSDKEGKSALYMMAVDRLVEKTENIE